MGYEVWGLVHGQAHPRVRHLRRLLGDVRLIRGDLLDQGSLINAVERVQPDEVYNLAAISYVPMSWQQAELTGEVTGLGVLRVLEAIRVCSGISASRTPGSGQIRFYQASTSEMFGNASEVPQRETTPFYPRSPYGAAKAYAHWITVNYREAYGLFACSGILFNHESPIRGETFVTRKITRALARIHEGLETTLYLGNLDSLRDWGHARDYVQAQWLMLQQPQAEDFVIATGEQHSVREFVSRAATELGISIGWQGAGLAEQGVDTRTGAVVVKVDPRYFRPTEVDALLGDASKARAKLGWTPQTSFDALVEEMVAADLQIARRDALIAREGFRAFRYRE